MQHYLSKTILSFKNDYPLPLEQLAVNDIGDENTNCL